MSNTYRNLSGLPKGDWDFIGFRYGDFGLFSFSSTAAESRENFNTIMPHCSKWGIKRVQNGLFSENNIPDFNDSTTKANGANETYYFGTEYVQRQISIDFAFDNMTEDQFVDLKRTFVSEEPKNLIFDEIPYKMYTVKLGSPMTLNYICFDKEGNRLFKGEGHLEFVSYYPFAKNPFKRLDDFKKVGYNTDNFFWTQSSGIGNSENGYTANSVVTNGDKNIKKVFFISNEREMEVPFILRITGSGIKSANIKIYPGNGIDGGATFSDATRKMEIDFKAKQDANHCIIDTKTHLVSNKAKDAFFNHQILSGDFFKLSPSDTALTIEVTNMGEPTSEKNIILEYNCLYY